MPINTARPLRLSLLALALGAALGLVTYSCGSGEQASTAGGGGGAGGAAAAASGLGAATSTTNSTAQSSVQASSSSSGAGVDKNGCQILPYPPGVPEGWVEWTDWSCDCRFYQPGSKEVMPPPIKWEACPTSIPGCRMMVTDWTDGLGTMALFPQFDVNEDGTGAIFFRRLQLDSEHPNWLDMVADVDGPVHMALLRMSSADERPSRIGCHTVDNSYQDQRVLVGLRGVNTADKIDSIDEGVMGGEPGAPRLLAHIADGLDYGWRGDKHWVLRDDSLMRLYAMPWSMTPETFITSAATDPENLQVGGGVLAKGAIFWESSGANKRAGINVWDQEGGTRPFIRWLNDYTRGAGGFGTDGEDMVWVYGDGKEPNDTVYPNRSIMTAKFTTDSATAMSTGRRLRSFPRKCITCENWIVNCGYATSRGEGQNTMVVRLSDGWSWEMPLEPHLIPFGLTCDEVFVSGYVAPEHHTIARIKLSELGPGMAPD